MALRKDAVLLLFLCPAIFSAGCVVPRIAKPGRLDSKAPDAKASIDPYQISNTSLQIQAPPPPKPETPKPPLEDPLDRLARIAAEKERSLNSYQVRVRRRETIDDKDQPMEYILFKFRRAPLSIHCKWLGEESFGREIVYVKGQYDDKIHILTGKGDLLGAGRQLALSPDSPLVLAKLRYPIAEAGFGSAALRFVKAADGVKRGDASAGSMKFLGEQTRSEIKAKGQIFGVEHIVPAGVEPGLSKGGVRYYYFDDAVGMPVLIVTLDHNKHQVEFYHFDFLQAEIGLDDVDFDHTKLWKK